MTGQRLAIFQVIRHLQQKGSEHEQDDIAKNEKDRNLELSLSKLSQKQTLLLYQLLRFEKEKKLSQHLEE